MSIDDLPDDSLADAERHLRPRARKASKSVLSAIDQAARAKAEKLLKAHLGEGGFREFLRQPQPSFADRRGSDILRDSPTALLERLEMLERSGE